MRCPLIAGNWKMNGNSKTVKQLLDALSQQQWEKRVEVIVFPSPLFINQAVQALQHTPIMVGAQDCATQSTEGALTGEVAASQLQELGCRYTLIGHSERRLLIGETNDIVAKKFAAAQQQNLTPILCVGETKEQREKKQTFDVITSQINSIIESLSINALDNAVIAYEPVWAIGTGETATPEQAQEVHSYIRSLIAVASERIAQKIQILYGGSVKANNANALFAMADIDGALIGGASLDAEEFSMIYKAAGN